MKLGRWTFLRGMALHVVGALLMFAAVSLVAVTARSQFNFRAIAVRHGGEIIELGPQAQPQPGQHGYMARIAGTPAVVEAPHDPDFNLRVNTPILMRHVEMFQWREVRISGSVHYEQDWVDHPLDASHFEQPAGHANPGAFPLNSEKFDAGLVQIGGFKLSPLLLHALPGSAPVTPDLQALPQNLAASFSRYQDYLVTSAQPGYPQLGDVRVSWDEVPLQPVTIVARIDGDRLVPATDASDGKGYHVDVGDVSLYDMFPDLPVPPQFVLVKQIIAVLLAALGAWLLLSSERRRRDALLALGLGALAVGAVASVLSAGNDNRAMAGWLVLTLLGIGLAIWRLRQYRRRTD